MSGANDPKKLREKLDAQAWEVTQNKATERPFTGAYLDNKAKGMYRCVCCEAPLFSSETKFDSGSGWPSFTLPLAGDNVRVERDISHGMIGDEVLCAHCDAHLGHVFPDGPGPGGQRYCINSCSLDFEEKE